MSICVITPRLSRDLLPCHQSCAPQHQEAQETERKKTLKDSKVAAAEWPSAAAAVQVAALLLTKMEKYSTNFPPNNFPSFSKSIGQYRFYLFLYCSRELQQVNMA